ncbi:hypothetical protein [uncultured Traorella sp.]|uniref:hypothetical protein n=1 Tax=uncultured Traorella sp. TaxID=1929048 RepID=UPI0025E60808|nr:hypothetical protein [uncultured Traorella sp.]
MMEKLKLYLTRKNVYFGNLVIGIVAIILGILYLSAGGNVTSLDDLGNVLSLLKFMCVLFYLDLIVSLLLTACLAFRLFYVKDHEITVKILGGLSLFSSLMGLLSFSGVHALYQLLNGNFMALFGLGGLSSLGTMLFLFVAGEIAQGVTAGYLLFVRKTEELDVSAVKEDAEQLGEMAKEKASMAMDAASREANKLSEKWKAYYATEKGKKTIRYGGITLACVVVVIVAVSVYFSLKKTPIDLTSSCELTYSGVSGEGYANVSCNVDYDQNNPNFVTFVNGVSYEVENNGSLSNGDTIVLKAIYSEETAKGSKIEVVNPQKEFTVEGLEVVYRTFADIPEDVSSQFAQAAETALRKDIEDTAQSVFGPDTIVINSCDQIGVYYSYNSYYHEGTAYYVYRTNVTEDYTSRSETVTEYYYVRINNISSREEVDLGPDSLTISRISLYGDEKTDEEAIESFKTYRSDLEVVSESLSDETYVDETVQKEN